MRESNNDDHRSLREIRAENLRYSAQHARGIRIKMEESIRQLKIAERLATALAQAEECEIVSDANAVGSILAQLDSQLSMLEKILS